MVAAKNREINRTALPGSSVLWLRCPACCLVWISASLQVPLPFLAKDLQITNHQQEWVVSSMMFGAALAH